MSDSDCDSFIASEKKSYTSKIFDKYNEENTAIVYYKDFMIKDSKILYYSQKEKNIKKIIVIDDNCNFKGDKHEINIDEIECLCIYIIDGDLKYSYPDITFSNLKNFYVVDSYEASYFLEKHEKNLECLKIDVLYNYSNGYNNYYKNMYNLKYFDISYTYFCADTHEQFCNILKTVKCETLCLKMEDDFDGPLSDEELYSKEDETSYHCIKMIGKIFESLYENEHIKNIIMYMDEYKELFEFNSGILNEIINKKSIEIYDYENNEIKFSNHITLSKL